MNPPDSLISGTPSRYRKPRNENQSMCRKSAGSWRKSVRSMGREAGAGKGMKTAIVSGSNRGIGNAIALRLAADGMSVVLCARDEELLNDTAKIIGEENLLVVASICACPIRRRR